jgi:hypothetical protein
MPIRHASSIVQACRIAPWPTVTSARPAVESRRAYRARHGHVQHAAILDVRARADADVVDVAARDRERPQRGVFAEFDIADHERSRVDVYICAKARKMLAVGSDIHAIGAG